MLSASETVLASELSNHPPFIPPHLHSHSENILEDFPDLSALGNTCSFLYCVLMWDVNCIYFLRCDHFIMFDI